MILVDTNLLVYAVDSSSPFHDEARRWLEGRFNGASGVRLPWQALNGFARLVSNPRVCPNPMSTARAEWTRPSRPRRRAGSPSGFEVANAAAACTHLAPNETVGKAAISTPTDSQRMNPQWLGSLH